MSKDNTQFFKEKKPWSEVKDALLACYLKPYFQKVLRANREIVYIDCCAGKGRFEDGKPGSPLIALQAMDSCTQNTNMSSWRISMNFVDLNYAEDLSELLKDLPYVKVIPGRYEEKVPELLKGKQGCFVFLYIDPYGIKALDFNLFDSLMNQHFRSVELLLNLNSFGFIREACRVLNVSFDGDEILGDLVEFDDSQLKPGDKSISDLNRIAGGDYWKEVIDRYRSCEISTYQAEMEFAKKYCERLGKTFKYVLNMPIRLREGQLPKYRMIHATNHADGATLMVDNIFKRCELMKDIQKCGQFTIWNEDADNNEINESELLHKVTEYIQSYKNPTRINVVMAKFFCKYGAICRTTNLKAIFKQLENAGRLEVLRTPSITKSGSLSRSFSDRNGQTIEMRWRA